jgi:hypothetical protein
MKVVFDAPNRNIIQLDSGVNHFEILNEPVGPDPPYRGRDYIAPTLNPYATRALSVRDTPVATG